MELDSLDIPLEFVACEKCAAKAPLEVLCDSCIRNRHVIAKLKREVMWKNQEIEIKVKQRDIAYVEIERVQTLNNILLNNIMKNERLNVEFQGRLI